MMLNTSEVLDLSKENVQPLRQGRKAAQLKTALQAQTDPEMQQRLLKQREEFEFAIRMYEGDDPLQPYWDYAAWLEQSFTKLGRESNLIPLLEDAIVKFKDYDKYRQDPRFVQLLIKYINAQSNPLELYQMSYDQGLGTMCSALYKAWAEELDRNHDFKRADNVYLTGIQCRAQPLEELKDAHIQFQLSIARKMLEGNINNSEQNVENSRTALSKLQPSKVKSSRISKDTAGIFQVANRDSKSNAMAPGKFKVYQEDEPDGIMKSDFKNKSEKFARGSVAERENIMKAGKWNGQKHKQSSVFKPSMPTTPSFQIHEDPEAACDNVKTVLRPRALKLRREEFKCPVAVFEDPDPTKKPMYPKHLVYVGGRDIQLEELRAAMYWRKAEKEGLGKKQPQCEESVLMETPNKSLFDQSNGKVEVRIEKSYPVNEPNQNKTPGHVYVESHNLPVDQSNKTESKTKLHSVSDIAHENDQPANLVCKKPEMKTELPHSIHEVSQRNVSAEVTDPLVGLFDKGGPIPHYSPSTSFTVNTRAAMNVIQTMWASPLPPSNVKCQKSSNNFDDSMFKVPSCSPPSNRQVQKKLTFPVFCDEEAPVALTQKLPSPQISSVDKLSFPDFTHEMLATSTQKPESCKGTPADKLSFPMYADENVAPSMQKSDSSKMTTNKLSFPAFSDEVLATSTQKPASGKLSFPIFTDEPMSTLQKPESSKKQSMFSFPFDDDDGILPLVGPKSDANRNKFSEVDKLLFPIDNDDEVPVSLKKSELGTPVQAGTYSIPLIVPVNLADTPLQPENKENLPPKSYATPIERRPLSGILTPACNVPVKPLEDDDSEDDEEYCKIIPKTNDFDDETCSTKAFAIALPSSTPFVRSRRSSPRKSLLHNGSFITEESAAKSTTEGSKYVNGQHLSLILENSKEQGSNSSGGSSAVNK